MNQEARTKLIKARIAMIMRQPFFGELAMHLKLTEDDTLDPPTAAVDGRNLFYHPQWVLDNPHEVVMAMVAHEVGHCIFQHIGRRNGREPQRWNYAGDYVINAVLQDSGFTLGDGWLYSPVYAGMSTDAVYQALPPMPPGTGKGAFDKILDAPAQGTDIAASDADWGVAAVQAANNAESRGNLPASLKRFVEEITEGKVDWRDVMRRFMTETSKDDYSYARLNRRFVSLGIYLPGLYSETMGAVVAGIDTSGSISKEQLMEFGSEITAIVDQMLPSKLVNIYCDAAIAHIDEFERYDVLSFDMHGGGGTDFRPPFKYVEDNDIEPKCMVYLTDGCGPFPAHAPPYPVLWLMTTDVVPPWGEVVRIDG
jgi:predicted metal-dependent peptidase